MIFPQMNKGDRQLKAPSELPAIPLLEIGKGGPLALLDAAPRRFGEIIEMSRRHYGEVVLRLGDVVSRRWLDKTANPYRHEIEAVAARAGRPGGPRRGRDPAVSPSSMGGRTTRCRSPIWS